MGFLKKLLKGAAIVGSLVGAIGWWWGALALAGTVIGKLKKWLTPDMPDKQAMLIQRIGSDYPIPVVYGTRKVGAIIVDRAVSNEPGGLENEVYHVFCVFSQGEIDSYVEFFFNGVSWNDARWTKNGLRYYNYQLATGTPEQNPLTAGAVFNRWSSTQSHYRGIATAIFSFRQDKDGTIWNGEPQITAVIKGKKCLDPHTSVTAYTENPAVHLYDYLRSPVYGLGMVDADIDLASIIAVANICDANETATVDTQICQTVDGVYTCTGGPAEVVNFKRFTHNNIIDTGRTLFDNVSEIANSYRGFFPDSDGRLKIGTEIEGNPVFSFNADNIVSSITSTLPGIKDRFNRVVVRFPNVENKYEMDECFYPATDDPLYAQWLAEDNGLNLEKVITAEYTVYKAEALQLAEVAVKASRNAESVQFTATPEALQLDVGDIIDITEENRGWINKEFRVAATEYREDYLVNITAIQHDDAIYPWSDLDYTEIVGGTNLGDPANIPAPTGLAITPDPTLATRGTLTWSYGQNAFVRRFLVVLLAGTTELERTETVGQSYVVPQIDSGSYTIQVRAISTIGFPSEAASISFTLALPVPPSSITTIVANFDITAIPVLAGIGLGTTFEFAIGSTAQVVGRGASMVFAGLTHGTEYTIYARTVNALGVSAWASTIATTTSDGTDLVSLVGEGIAAELLPQVVGELEGQLQDLVDESIAQLPTVEEVQTVIDNALAGIAQQQGEDPRVGIIDFVSNILANSDTNRVVSENKRQVDSALAQASGDLGNLNTVVIPALNDALDTANGEINTLKTVTLPALQNDLDAAQGEIDTLRDVTLPALDEELTAVDLDLQTAKGEILGIQGRFPVQTVDIGENSITATKITDGAIETPKLSAGAVIADKIAANAVTADKIIANAVIADKIAANAVTADKIIASAITTDKIASNAVVADKIAANAISADKIVAGAITTDKMTVNSINGDRIAANTLNADKIVAGSITTFSMTANTINGDRIAANTLNADKIVSNSITSDKIAANAITAGKIASGSITANKIVAGAVETDKIAANAVVAASIAAGAIVSDKIAANAVTAVKIVAGAIESDKIAANAITAGKIAVDALDGKLITGTIVRTALPAAGFRAVLGEPLLPIWYGSGEVSSANGYFYVNDAGTVYAKNLVVDGQSVLLGNVTSDAVITGGTIKTSGTGYRSEMSGSGAFPFWYGSGDKTSGNGLFYVDEAGNVVMQNSIAYNSTMVNAAVQGRLVTDSGSGDRTEIYDDGTYLIWIGSGAKNDANGTFWIKKNGTGFIKGDFFSGQIIETRMGSYSNASINSAVVSAGTHNSAGKPVEITANCSVSLTMAGNTESSLLIIAGNIRRNATFVATVQSVIAGYWDLETNTTLYTGGFSRVAVDNRAVEEARDYDVVFYVPQFPVGSVNSAQTDITIRTFENKLE